MRFPKYEKYRDSGIEWMGRIPEHWTVSQSRRMFRVRSEPARKDDQMLTASQKYGVLPQAEFVQREGRRVVEVIQGIESLKHVEPDDFIISMRSFQGGIEWCRIRGSTSFHYVMLTPVKWVWPPYFSYLLKSSSYIQALRRTTDLIRDGQELRFSNFAQVPLPVVPVEEQVAIAKFLFHETAKIDEIIGVQERLITLLSEKRQATITRAVTRGLKFDAPMKDSGVAWLGQVPEHWSVDRLKASIKSCNNGIWGDEPCHNGKDIACVRVADFDRTKLMVKESIPTLRSITDRERVGRLLTKGNLLLEKSGGGESQPVGQVVMYQLDSPAVCSNFVARMTLLDGMVPAFWNYVHSAAYSVGVNVGSIKQTSGIQNLDQDSYFNERAAFPPTSEQIAISEFLDVATARLDSLGAEAKRAVALLRERRSALINAAVTGQIDVRAATNV